MIPDEEDIQRRIKSENSLAHLKDQERLIIAKEKEAEKVLRPIRKRGIQNHFIQEANELMDRRLRGEQWTQGR